MSEVFDFGGYATKNDLKCADGRTIRKGAFKDCDGVTVPLVWGHNHGKPGDILGHAVLENRDDGVYAYGVFNDTESGKNAKELVRHGDIRALSIYANNLVQKGGDVLHGMIREVSLCLAGANPGARIEDLSFEHYDDEETEFEAVVFNGDNIVIQHSDDKEDEAPKEKEGVKNLEEVKEEPKMASDKTVGEVFDELTDEQKDVVYYMIGEALQSNADDDEDEDEGEDDEEMKHNLFDMDYDYYEPVITHDMLSTVIEDGKKYGTLKDSFEHHLEEGVLAHAVDTTGMTVPSVSNADYGDPSNPNYVGYGVNSPDFLFPEARAFSNIPEFIQRNMDWVTVVWNGVHKSPFSRVKSVFANITEDEARAKGYIKGNQKKNEFFSLMKRTTTPQTVYKKQKMDRDDVVDITDFDVVQWIKAGGRSVVKELGKMTP